MRIESSVTSVSWIPSEAVKGMVKMPFEVGVGHYDDPLPDVIDVNNLEAMRDNDQFRFANHLRAWIRVENGRIIDFGQSGGTILNSTHMKIGPKEIVFQATAFPEIRPKAKITKTSATFVQTCGGRPGMPAPRRVRRKPYIQLRPPTVWTTLKLTLHADGRIEQEMTGATPFPRHWVYDGEGKLHVVGHTSGFRAKEKRELPAKLAPYETGERGTAEPSRWAADRDLEWIDLRPELVVEVSFDHVSGGRIRHGTKLLRWREDKPPAECRLDQLDG